MKTYTAWGTKDGPDTLIEGTDPPKFNDGTLMPDAEVLHATFKAHSWKHATNVYNALRECSGEDEECDA
jgi:hypothetical protein